MGATFVVTLGEAFEASLIALAGLLVIGPGLGQHRRALALARKRSPEQP